MVRQQDQGLNRVFGRRQANHIVGILGHDNARPDLQQVAENPRDLAGGAQERRQALDEDLVATLEPKQQPCDPTRALDPEGLAEVQELRRGLRLAALGKANS